MIRQEQCNKVCRILDDVLANRPTERDSIIIAVRKAFESLELFGNSEQFPSAQPEQHLDEWCVDCKEYDKEKHSCPRWNRVIRQTLLDAQPERKTGHWILDRSGAYCCSKCMEPCASYAMMRPRDKYCKMCGSRNEVQE